MPSGSWKRISVFLVMGRNVDQCTIEESVALDCTSMVVNSGNESIYERESV